MKCMQIMKMLYFGDIWGTVAHADVPMHVCQFQNMVQ